MMIDSEYLPALWKPRYSAAEVRTSAQGMLNLRRLLNLWETGIRVLKFFDCDS